MIASAASAAALAAVIIAATGAAQAPASAPLEPTATQVAMSDAAAVVLDESSGGSAQARVGDKVEVRLKAQFGTGFSWAMAKATETVLKPAGEAVIPAGGTQPPEGGFETQVYTFEAAAPGEGQLEFVYRRPWLPDDPTNKHVTFTVTVKAK